MAGGLAQTGSTTRRGEHRAVHHRYLPQRDLRAHPPGHRAGGAGTSGPATARRGVLRAPVSLGGLASLGIPALILPRGAGAAPADAHEAVELTSWVVITPDGGVRLRIPQSETGQGVEAALAQVVAEALGLEWPRCETGFCDPQVKRTRNDAQVHTATLNSRAVDPLQIAGAQIRAMLVRAASAQARAVPRPADGVVQAGRVRAWCAPSTRARSSPMRVPWRAVSVHVLEEVARRAGGGVHGDGGGCVVRRQRWPAGLARGRRCRLRTRRPSPDCRGADPGCNQLRHFERAVQQDYPDGWPGGAEQLRQLPGAENRGRAADRSPHHAVSGQAHGRWRGGDADGDGSAVGRCPCGGGAAHPARADHGPRARLSQRLDGAKAGPCRAPPVHAVFPVAGSRRTLRRRAS
jgi:hypothetical protein